MDWWKCADCGATFQSNGQPSQCVNYPKCLNDSHFVPMEQRRVREGQDARQGENLSHKERAS